MLRLELRSAAAESRPNQVPALKRAGIALLLALLLPLSGCHRKSKKAADIVQFSEQQLWKESQEFLDRGKLKKASAHLKLLLDQYPMGTHVKDAQLLYADTLFKRGSDANLIEAQSKYLAYIAFYPTDQRSAYAQYQVALCNFERRGKPNRDQTVTRDAINEFQKVIQGYPKSDYVADAKEKIALLTNELGDHEYQVAYFYRRRGFRESVVRRLRFLLDKYPDYRGKEQSYFMLADTLRDLGQPFEAATYFKKLLEEFPSGKYAKEARKGLAKVSEEPAKDKGG